MNQKKIRWIFHGMWSISRCSNPEVPSAECSVYPCTAKGNTAVGETVTRKPRSLQPKSCARWAVQGMGKGYRSRLEATKASRFWGKRRIILQKKYMGKLFWNYMFFFNAMEWNQQNPRLLLLFWFLICFGGLPTLIWNSWMGLQGNLHHCSMYRTYALSSSVFYGR